MHFCYFGLFIALVPVTFSNHNSILDDRIWFVDLLNQSPGNTTSISAVIEQNKYVINIININSKDPLEIHSYVTGTNIGLVWPRNMGKGTLHSDTTKFFLSRPKRTSEKIEVLLAISTYTKDDPVPGGCNFKFETIIAPYQKVSYDDGIITVTSQPPSRNEEYNNDPKDYFLGIEQMISVNNIRKYGTKVHSRVGDKHEQMYNLYRGTGRVFAVISTLNGKSSAYIPTVSFGCNISNWTEDCIGPVGVHWKLICAFLLILGIFICFGGHRYFKVGLFTMGFTFGAILTLLVSSDDYYSTEVKAIYSLSAGFVCGCVWLFFWWKFGAPLLSIQLTFLLAGTLIASTILYNELGDLFFLTDDVIFWLVFSVIVLTTLTPIFCYPSLYHIIALSLLGSYAFVVALNYYIGGNLPYILINTYRRITVKEFGFVVVDPPYQMLDISQTFLWALLFGIGVYIQYKHSIGKAPFPSTRAGINGRLVVNERTPLLRPEGIVSPSAPDTFTVTERTPLISSQQDILEIEAVNGRVPPPPYRP